jgi:superfamily II DNA/RNA helicase
MFCRERHDVFGRHPRAQPTSFTLSDAAWISGAATNRGYMSFAHLGLSDKVLAAVAATGYTTPTPIQDQAIPHVLARRDVLGIAQTGTGKTAAFVLPMLTMLEQGRARARMPRTLILEPTRELAAQVEESFIKYGAKQKLNVALIIGGVSFDDQDTKLMRGVDVLIATPGRLLDHFERGRLLLTGAELLVIDEADRMLDMGFIPDIERICKLVPFTRQTLFFTATMPPEIRRITEQFLHNPVKVEVSRPASTLATTTQNLVKTGREPHDKRDTLRRLIRSAEGLKNGIIFCNRKREVALLHRSLVSHGFSAVALHGDLDQSARTAALDQFRRNEVTLLVASDVAARGLDIPDVSHVFNFDVPHHADDYVHRIGRTGRAGRSGVALTIVSPADQKSVAAIEKLIGQSIPWTGEPPAAFDGEESRPAEHGGSRRGGRGGRPRPERSHGERSHGERSHGERSHAERSHPERPRGEQSHAERPQDDRSQAAERPRERQPQRQRQQPGPVASLDAARPPSRPAPAREHPDDSADTTSHLPAFLFRPTRLKA